MFYESLPGKPPAGIYPSPAQRSSPVFFSLQECSAAPLFERKDNKEAALLDLDGKANTLTKRYAAIRDTGVKIQEMVEVRHIPGRFSQSWFNKECVQHSCAAML